MTILFNDLKPEYEIIKDEVREAIDGVFGSGRFILGRQVSALEQEFADYCGVRHGVAVASGTDAIWLGLLAFDVGSGDEVITAANTALPTVAAIWKTGATPVLVDVDQRSFNLSPEAVEKSLSQRSKAIIPVHLYGQPAEMRSICGIAKDHGVKVLEDACQAHGATYFGKKTGALGDAATFSFYPTKNLGAYGDGGMVVTNDDATAARLRLLRDYGQEERYHHVAKGYNSRLDELQAAVLRVKLRHLDDWNDQRRAKAALYGRLLTRVTTPTEAEGVRHVFHLYVVRCSQRDRLKDFLESVGIGTMIHYPRPVHLQPACSDLGLTAGAMPEAEACARQILSLPLYNGLSDQAVQQVAERVNEFYGD